MDYPNSIVFGVVAATVIACNSTTNRLPPRVGQTRAQLLAELGEPDKNEKLSDGREMLTWLNLQRDTGTYCRKAYILSSAGIVENASQDGCGSQIFEAPSQ